MLSSFVPLSRSRHAQLRLISLAASGYRHAAKLAAVALCLVEVEYATHEFPLAFLRLPNGQMRLLGLLGTPGTNLLVASDGRWLGRYVPAILRAHPFGWQRGPKDRAVLCIDETCPRLSTTEGEPLFAADGTLTGMGGRGAQLVQQLVQQFEATEVAAQRLFDCGVLEPWAPLLPGQDAPPQGLFRVAEAKLRQLPGNVLAALSATESLPLAYAQLLSMPLLQRLRDLAERRPTAADGSDAGGLGDLEFVF